MTEAMRRRERFVTEYLACGVVNEAYRKAGYKSKLGASCQASASRLFNRDDVQRMLLQRLPQRNVTEMARIYGKLNAASRDAHARYEAAEGKDKLTWFRSWLDALRLQAQAAGLLVKVKVDVIEEQKIVVIHQNVEIVPPRPQATSPKPIIEHPHIRKAPEPASLEGEAKETEKPPTSSPSRPWERTKEEAEEDLRERRDWWD